MMATYYAAWDKGKWDHFSKKGDAQVAAAKHGGVFFGTDLELLRSYLSSGLDIDTWVRQLGGPPPPLVSTGGGGGPIGGLQDPSGGGTLAGELGPESMLGSGTSDFDTAGANQNFLSSPLGRALIEVGLSLATNKLLGGRTSEERRLGQFSTAPFASREIQGFLPTPLRAPFTDPILAQGIARIGELLSRPGGLSGSVADAIRPRLAQESETLGQNFRNLRSEQAGAAARGNLPVSIKNALQSALGIGEERAQRELRRSALEESEGLRRQDLGQTFNLLDAMLQFTSSGRGQAIGGLQSAASMSGQRQASKLAFIADLLTKLPGFFKKPETVQVQAPTGFGDLG